MVCTIVCLPASLDTILTVFGLTRVMARVSPNGEEPVAGWSLPSYLAEKVQWYLVPSVPTRS
jgi:hypothetical protein